MLILRKFVAAVILVSTSVAQSKVPVFTPENVKQTASEAHLSSAQLRMIVEPLEASDVDWDRSRVAQLRYSWVKLSRTEKRELLVKSIAQEDCGGTGNCAYWILKFRYGKPSLLLATYGEDIGLQSDSRQGFCNIVTVSNLSIDTETATVFIFDGHTYIPQKSYEMRVRK